jgi:hypothetical protein
MMHGLIAAVTMVALAGCSDKFEADLTACKAQTMEAFSPAQVSEQEPAAHLRECMYNKGWLVRDACVEKHHMWGSPDCYLR